MDRHIVKDKVDSHLLIALYDNNLDNNKQVGGFFYVDMYVIIVKCI